MNFYESLILDIEEWSRSLSRRKNVLNGKPTFPNTEISVEEVGRMISRGIPITKIKKLYPSLSYKDLSNAKFFVFVGLE